MAERQILTLFSSATRTATANGSTVAIPSAGGTKPITGETDKFNDKMMVTFAMTSVLGTNPTIDYKVQGRVNSSAQWVDLTPSSAFTQSTTVCFQSRLFDGPIPDDIRGVLTVQGTQPTIVCESHAVVLRTPLV